MSNQQSAPRSFWAARVGFLLVLAYAVPLFFPPPPSWAPGGEAAPWLFDRIFRGVPGLWVLGRLLCLGFGAALLASELVLPAQRTAAGSEGRAAAPNPPALVAWAAMLVAAAHGTSAAYASELDRTGELLYFVLLAVPALMLALSAAGGARRRFAARPVGVRRVLLLFVLPALWVIADLPLAWRSPRIASIVDGWLGLQRLDGVARGAQKALFCSVDVGLPNSFTYLQGLPLLVEGHLEQLFFQIQAANVLWTVVTALVAGLAARRMLGLQAALVVQAALLFSPYVLSFLYNPLPIFLAPLGVGLLLLQFLMVRDQRSVAALVAFAAVAGFSVRNPLVAPITVLLCVLTLISLTRRPRLPWTAVAAALGSGAAGALPYFPTPEYLRQLAGRFASGTGRLYEIVLILFGQASPTTLEQAQHGGQARPLEIAVAALLTPLASVRDPLRLWGDALLEPVTASLLAVALILAVKRSSPRNRDFGLVLAVVALGMAPALVSPGDQVSHMRISGGIAPLAVLAGFGFEAIRARAATSAASWRLTIGTTLLIALSGLGLFHLVNPTILPESSMAISFESFGDQGPPDGATFVEYNWPGGPDYAWLQTRRIAENLAPSPLRVLTVPDFRSRELSSPTPPSRLYFWSPALGEDAHLWRDLCAKWPGAALYTLWDRPHLFRALAAAPTGDTWRPALAPERWSVASCDAAGG